MDDLEEFESWHEDLMAWERTTLRIKAYPCNRKPPRNLSQNAATIH